MIKGVEKAILQTLHRTKTFTIEELSEIEKLKSQFTNFSKALEITLEGTIFLDYEFEFITPPTTLDKFAEVDYKVTNASMKRFGQQTGTDIEVSYGLFIDMLPTQTVQGIKIVNPTFYIEKEDPSIIYLSDLDESSAPNIEDAKTLNDYILELQKVA